MNIIVLQQMSILTFQHHTNYFEFKWPVGGMANLMQNEQLWPRDIDKLSDDFSKQRAYF